MGARAPARPATLLVHDGELADVRALLGRLAVPTTERRGALAAGDLEQSWGLVVTTPQRTRALRFSGSPRPTCIAICDRDSRTLRNALRRAGVALMVRRPVHPAALRALVLHALYRGPERRRNARVSIGAPVWLRRLFRRERVILADLSVGGCRLLTDRPVEAGRRITLFLPPELAGGRGLALRARALRHWQETPDGDHCVAAKFDAMRARKLESLRRIVEAFADGPATFEAGREEAPVAEAAESRAPLVTEECRSTQPARSAPEPRATPQCHEAARVLLGRDLSIAGMRVDRDAKLRVGSDVRLAIHVTTLDTPLVVTARVHRDEGRRGIVLRFHALSAEENRHLTALVDSLPAFDPDAHEGGGVVVSELLDAGQAAAASA